MSQDCKWCSRPHFMRKLLPDYVNKPLCEWHEVLLDLCYCFNCVQEYHRLAEELIEQESELKKVSSVLSAELRYINCLELKSLIVIGKWLGALLLGKTGRLSY